MSSRRAYSQLCCSLPNFALIRSRSQPYQHDYNPEQPAPLPCMSLHLLIHADCTFRYEEGKFPIETILMNGMILVLEWVKWY